MRVHSNLCKSMVELSKGMWVGSQSQCLCVVTRCFTKVQRSGVGVRVGGSEWAACSHRVTLSWPGH